MVQISTDELNHLLVCSFRYAFGRMSYITDTIAEIIANYSEHLTAQNTHTICKDILIGIEKGNHGMEIDKEIWEKLFTTLQSKKKD